MDEGVKGGQGREPIEVITAANVVWWCLCCAAFLAGLIIGREWSS